jgi:hypothetical protein
MSCPCCRTQITKISRIQGTRRAKLLEEWKLEVIGLTGDMHRSDWCRPSKNSWVGDPAPMHRWPGTPLYAAGWPDPYGWVTRGWPNFIGKWWFEVKDYERLNTLQLMNLLCVVTKFEMSLTKFLTEQSALFEKFKISLAPFKGSSLQHLSHLWDSQFLLVIL